MIEPANILLIDDDQQSNRLVESALVAAGYRVAVAGSHAEAMESLEAAKPDAIVVGLEAPTTEGAALASMLCLHERTRRIPIVLLGHSPTSPPNAVSQITSLPKPLDAQVLVSVVNRRLQEKAATPELQAADPPTGSSRLALDLRSKVVEKLTSETVRIQEEERRKLSLELHDDIAQILGNLVLMIDACMAVAPVEAERLHRYLAEARETAKEGFRRVQHFSVELRPPILDDLGLAPTLAWYAERFTRDNDIQVDVALPDRLPSLTGEQETALFRIVQEALNNVRKHAQARQVNIALEQRPGHLRLTITDDGLGFDPDEVEHKVVEGIHLGLAGMRYRAELLKGSFDVISAKGRGTTVVAEIPLR